MRKIRPTSEFDIFDVIDDGSKNQEEIMILTQVHSDLKILIEQLPEEQKEVLKMRYLKDLSFKEISDLTNSSINTALGRMRYALINLRKLAEKQHIDLQLK
jgi:RNA polymerase sigma-70 factor (ECF subfamily)